jgi:hypothetical protein
MYSEINVPQYHFFHHKTHKNFSGIRDDSRAAYLVNHGTVFKTKNKPNHVYRYIS